MDQNRRPWDSLKVTSCLVPNKSVHSCEPQWLDPCPTTIKATTSNQRCVSSGCLIMFQMALKKGLHRKVTMSSRHFLSINMGVIASIQAFFLLGVTFRLVPFQSSKLNMPHISINIHKSGRNPYTQWIGFVGKILTGNHRFSHEIWGFPVNFPLNQSIDIKQPFGCVWK